MPEPLPHFRYHPDPLATGMVQAAMDPCVCCGAGRGFVYVGPVYAAEDLQGKLCPWCIADGEAASKFKASFADAYPLLKAGIPAPVVEEVSRRTPGYVSWQQEWWLSHCQDACAFHGDASIQDVASASPETKTAWMREYKQDEAGWTWVATGYRAGGDSALYKFRCLHCQLTLFGWDLC